MPILPAKMKILLILAKTSRKIATKLFPQCPISHENLSYSQIFCDCSIGGTFDLRLVKNLNPFRKYCIALNKCPGLNTLTGISNQERMIKSENIYVFEI